MPPLRSTLLTVSRVATVVVVGWCAAAGAGARQAEPDRAEPVRLPGQINLDDLVELATKRLGVSVQYQREALRKPVSLRLNTAVSDDELWRVVTAVLEGQGLVVVRTIQPGVYRVVPVQAAANENQRVLLPGEADEPPAVDQPDRSSYVSLVTRLRSLGAEEAAKAVQPLLTPASGLAKPIGDGGLLLIGDVRRRVDQALQLLELIDGPPDPMTSFVIDFGSLTSAECGKLLESVWSARAAAGKPGKGAPAAGATGAASLPPRVIPLAGERRAMVVCPASAESEVRRLLSELDRREPRETRGYAATGIGPDQLAGSIRLLLDLDKAPGAGTNAGAGGDGNGPRVVVDRLTGSVLVSGGAQEHARVAGLIERLDALPAASRQVLRSFTIKNRDASELSLTLRDLLGAGGVAAGADAAADQPTPRAGDAAAVPNPRPRDAAGGGPDGSGLWITVDKPTNAVMAVGDPSLLGQLETLIQKLDRRQPQVMLDVTLVTLSSSESLSIGVELQKRFEDGDTTVNLASLFGLATGGPLQGGTGFNGTVVRVDDYQILVRALEAVTAGRSTSIPRVLVANNAKSTLRSVQRQPFTSINASNTVATTSFGGTEDAGTTVTVKPQITEGDHLVLDYSVELSAFTGPPTQVQGGGIVPPPSLQNAVDGTVTLPDGYTVVVGGLSNETKGKSNSRVPGLGAIPILGALFGTTTDTDSSSRFFVFIRANILRDTAFEDLRDLGARDLAAGGVDDGIPELRPQWIE